MGCIGVIFKLIFFMFDIAITIIIYVGGFLFAIIKVIVDEIKKNRNKKKNNIIYNQPYYQKETTNIKSIENKYNKTSIKNINNSYLRIYISKKYTSMKKDGKFNYTTLGIKSYDAPALYYEDDLDVKGYNVFEAVESSSERYGDILDRIYKLCGNDFYATIGYEQGQVDYKITIKDNNIFINGNNVQFMKNKYLNFKNKIISFSDKLYDYFIYIEDNNFYNSVVPIDSLDCESISVLANKLKDSNDILLFEIPYMEEISKIIDIIEPEIVKEYNKGQEKVFNSLPDINVIEEEPIYESNIKEKKEKEMSWEEEEFEREADLWGLSEEDRRIAKEERMSPADFVEAEEYDDDELLLDEWER